MIARIIDWSVRNRLIVLALCLLLLIGGIESLFRLKLDALPDLSDVQVIVKTDLPGQSPQLVEDQLTYPLAASLLSVPGTKAVRGFSMFGESYVYVIFKDGTDLYWARSRILESLSQSTGKLPAGVAPTLGPDASGVGWVFEYALVDKSGKTSRPACAHYKTSTSSWNFNPFPAWQKLRRWAGWLANSRSRQTLPAWPHTA